MAKKTTKAPETSAAPAPAPAPVPPGPITGVVAAGTQEAKDKMAAVRAARGTGDNSKDTFKFLPYTPPATAAGQPVPPDPRKKLAPQAMTIVNTLAALPNATATREALEKACTGVLMTKQPVGRIITYYQKNLVDHGYIALTKAPAAAPAPVAAPAA